MKSVNLKQLMWHKFIYSISLIRLYHFKGQNTEFKYLIVFLGAKKMGVLYLEGIWYFLLNFGEKEQL